MDHLRHILHGLHDAPRLSDLADWFERQATIARQLARDAESSLARSAELTAQLEKFRASKRPSRVARDKRVMTLARRGLSDTTIGAAVQLSGRQVRRIIARELGR
jgi:hypothetical protein